MKKIVLVLILCLVLVGFVKLPNVGASTNSVDDLNTIFDTYYNDGYYTKETKIYLNETATNELTTLNCWHNNVSLLERTTYYKGDALWMSNHLGGYSYYGTSGNNMTHAYVSSLEETSDKIVVSGKTMEEYYYTLLDLTSTSEQAWTNNNGVYTTNDTEIIEIFKAITAPCYLGFADDQADNYITLTSASVTVSNGYLVLKLHASSNKGALTNGDVFSEATIHYQEKHDVYVDGQYVQTVLEGSKLNLQKPTKDGHLFLGWLHNSSLWNMENDVVTSDTYLTTSWRDIRTELKNKDWSSYQAIETDAMSRYQFKAHAAPDGLYFQATQYVDEIQNGGVAGVWNDITHLEMMIYNHSFGLGWDGTYFGFFPDGSCFYNNGRNLKSVSNFVDIIENPTESEYNYKLVYNIYLQFDNNLDNPGQPPYAYLKFMVGTPGEGVKGYENTSMLYRDRQRMLWTDHCESYQLSDLGVVAKIKDKPIYDATSYQTIAVDAPNRYEYYGYACDEGLVINAVQYVDEYSVGANWLEDEHIEALIYNNDFGYGWGGTYCAFFMDGSYYVNNMTNVKEVVNRVTVAESDGPYKYKITYQIFIGFDNNLANPQAGPYGYIQLMSFTPGEDTTGYENAKKIIQDSVRELWKDNCVSYHFARNGIMQKMYT